MTTKQLREKALKLKPIEKIHLVELILESLDKTDPEIEKIWIKESEARYEAYKKGQLKATSWEAVRKKLKR